MSQTPLTSLLDDYAAAQAWSAALIEGLTPEQVAWRPNENSSAIGWHLGHQAAVNHYMVRNLTAAEESFNPAFDAIFDSATTEPNRGDLPPLDEIMAYRANVAATTTHTVGRIASGEIGSPNQLPLIADAMVRAIINHEYQHAKWIGEVRDTMIDTPAPTPDSANVAQVDGYWMVQ